MLQKKPIDKNKKPLDKNKNKNKKGNILLKSNLKLIILNDVPLLFRINVTDGWLQGSIYMSPVSLVFHTIVT